MTERAVFIIKNGKQQRLANARAGRPADDICDDCGSPMEVGTFPACGGNPAKHGPIHRREFKPFEIELDGKTVTIGSLQDADRVERESWQRYNTFDKNGKRQGSPSVLRLFHQNWSNRDRNSLEGVGQSSKPMRPFNSKGERTTYGSFRPDRED